MLQIRIVMDKSKIANEQLKFLYEEIRNDLDNSKKIRNWCVTVWMASLAAISYEKIELVDSQLMIFPFVPILLFWLLDAFQNTFASLKTRLVIDL